MMRNGSAGNVTGAKGVTGYKGDNHSTCEDSQDAREAMARSSTGLTWAYTNKRTSAGCSGLLQLMGGS